MLCKQPRMLFQPDDMLEVVVNLTNNKINMMLESFTVEQLASFTCIRQIWWS